ncbi:MAG: nucleoside hydrolase [Chloroflexia bacterium]
MTKVHLDTDIGGDIDDLCALAMLLRWPGVELCGITTVSDDNGRRAGYVRFALSLVEIEGVPIAAGADISGGYYRERPGFHDEERYWPEPIAPAPGDLEEAIGLLKESIEQGAAIMAVGPYTNLRLLDERHPGTLKRAKLYLMGGYIFPPRPGFATFRNEYDYNIQVDMDSARYVLENADPVVIPLSVTAETFLRRAWLEDLRKSGSLGRLIARQAEAFAEDERFEFRYGQMCEALPNDIINFQHDPLACAIALGWDEGVEIEVLPLVFEEKDSWLTERIDASGKPTRVVTRVDGARFSEFWLELVAGPTQ